MIDIEKQEDGTFKVTLKNVREDTVDKIKTLKSYFDKGYCKENSTFDEILDSTINEGVDVVNFDIEKHINN